jgi:methionyl aminopeptidase
VGHPVGVDHVGTTLGEQVRYGALAARNVSGQSYDVARRHQVEEMRQTVGSARENAPFWYSSRTDCTRKSKLVRFRPLNENQITLKSARELDAMRESASRLKRLMRDLIVYTKPGVTAKEIDQFAAQKCKEYELKSGAYGYGHGANRFPGHICVSINEVVVHGIPGPRRVEEGDIVSLDVAVSHRGWFSDTCITLPMGEVTPDKQRLLEVCEAALWKGIDAAKPGNRLADIADAIQGYSEQHDFTVVSAFVGHGIGRAMHEPPQVHHCNPPNRGPLLRPGMVICIEPQITPGSGDIEFLSDGWTAVTKDGALSAHFEHTVAITPDGPEILTSPYDE